MPRPLRSAPLDLSAIPVETAGEGAPHHAKVNHERIYRDLRRGIEEGSYPERSRLPSVRVLARRYETCPNTISKVVGRLMESGLCTALPGVGLFVRGEPQRQVPLLVADDGGSGEHDGLIDALVLRGGTARVTFAIHRIPLTHGADPTGLDLGDGDGPLVCIGLGHHPLIDGLAAGRRPVLVLGVTPNRAHVSSIAPNGFRSGYLAARSLVRRGSRRIAVIGRRHPAGAPGLPVPDATDLAVLAGVHCIAQEEGLALPRAWVFADAADFAERGPRLGESPDAVIMSQWSGADPADLAAVLGRACACVVIGDERVRDHDMRPAGVIVRQQDIAELAMAEILRLAASPAPAVRTHMVDGELADG